MATMGIGGGPSISTFWGNEYPGYEGALHYNAFMRFERAFKSKPRLAILTAFGYQVQGTSFRASLVKENITLNYLSVPILIKYYMPQKELFFVSFGPYFNYLLEANSEITNSNNRERSTSNVISQFEKTDYGLSLGAGKVFKLNSGLTILFEIRDNLGLKNITRAGKAGRGVVRNNSLNFDLTLAYKIIHQN